MNFGQGQTLPGRGVIKTVVVVYLDAEHRVIVRPIDFDLSQWLSKAVTSSIPHLTSIRCPCGFFSRRQPLDTIHLQDAGYVMTPSFNGHGVANQQALTSPFLNGGGYNIQGPGVPGSAIPGMPNFAMGAGQGQTPSAQPPQFHFGRST